MSRARVIAAVCVLAGLLGAGYWFTRSSAPRGGVPAVPAQRTARVRLAELRHQEPAAVAGMVTASGKAVAAATVCARAEAAAVCAQADASGAWELANLPPGAYSVWASAAGMHGAPVAVVLGAGEHRGGVQLALIAGAVEVRGTVRDVRGAPIAGARVELGTGSKAPPTYATQTGADGAFSAWARPGDVYVAASAAGFVDGDVSTTAPDAAVAIVLTPGGSLAGTVIDAATRLPVVDANVDALAGEPARTDGQGRFVLAKLPPGRYKPQATTIGGYGEAPQSVLVALGQRVDGVVIEVHPVAVVAGRIAIDHGGGAALEPCPAEQGEVGLVRYGANTGYFAKTLDDGVVLLEGVGPGTYAVTVSCKRWLSQVPYPDLVVGDSDVEDVTWKVTAGGRVAGSVRAATGEPIAGAVVNLTAADRVSVMSVESGSDGAFAADGLGAGMVALDVMAEGFLTSHDKATALAAIGKTATVDVVLARGGGIAGLVVDEAGAPIADAQVSAVPDVSDDGMHSGADQTDRTGAFRIAPLAPGAYHVEVETAFHEEAHVHVAATVGLGSDAALRITVPRPSGAIDGRVVDANGAPVGDAYVTVALQDPDRSEPHFGAPSDAVLAGLDGSFHLGGLPRGTYGVRAYRPGGAETTVPNVALGARVTVTLRPTGVLAGVVVAANGAAVTDVVVAAEDRVHDVSREERAYFTGGQFALRDLPAGDYKLTVNGDPESAQRVTLADGEQRTDLRLVAQARYGLHGRLVRGGAPLVGWRVEVPRLDTVDQHGDGRTVETDTIQMAVTGADGTFSVHDLPAAKTTISAFDVALGADAKAAVEQDVTPAGAAQVIEVGDVVVP